LRWRNSGELRGIGGKQEHLIDSWSGCNWVLYQAMKEIKKSRWKRLKFIYLPIVASCPPRPEDVAALF